MHSLARWALLMGLFSSSGPAALAQAVRPLPYSAQLRTDPAVGNVQGIQRYGRPLRTDPDQGEGYSYHVYPVLVVPAGGGGGVFQPLGAVEPAVAEGTAAQPAAVAQQEADFQRLLELQKELAAQEAALQRAAAADRALWQKRVASTRRELAELNRALVETLVRQQLEARLALPPAAYPYPAPFDATAGQRNPGLPEPMAARARQPTPADPRGWTLEPEVVTHQPLIQVKVRIVDVVRSDSLALGSVLDYISRDPNDPTRVSFIAGTYADGNTINNGLRNLSGATRFPVTGLLGIAGGALDEGSGLLVNLTSEHINWITSLLASELNADVVTAPEVTVLNGQNVEFVAGSKVPFVLGQNVIQGTNNNIQQFFYKHVGTYVSVTPRIVNWSRTHAFRGRSEGSYWQPIELPDVDDWPGLWGGLTSKPYLHLTPHVTRLLKTPSPTPAQIRDALNSLLGCSVVEIDPESGRRRLRQIDRRYLEREFPQIRPTECNTCENWKPNDCTIDLQIVVRLSEASTVEISAPTPDGTFQEGRVSIEDGIRAIANIVQVKSGHGVVMAGLIGRRDQEAVNKVPVLGDIPVVGYLFRSKETARVKTETLIFIEARVLDSDPHRARAESHRDFTLGGDYVRGELLDSPLEYGFYRAGFGTYLPPPSCQERVFWQRLGRKIRKAATEVDDALE